MSPNNPLAPKRNSSARSHESPSSSFINASQSMDCFAVRMPPAGLNPTAMPVCCAYSRIARTITRLTGSVALVGSFPVEVLMKSAPAIIATTLARATLRKVSKIACAENALSCERAARLFEGGDFVVKRLPSSAEDVRSGDDDVNLVRPGFHGTTNFRDPFSKRR